MRAHLFFPLILFFLLFATFSWNQLIFSTEEDGCMYFEDFSLRLYFSVYLLSLFGLKNCTNFTFLIHIYTSHQNYFLFLFVVFLSVNFRVFILFFFLTLQISSNTFYIWLRGGCGGFHRTVRYAACYRVKVSRTNEIQTGAPKLERPKSVRFRIALQYRRYRSLLFLVYFGISQRMDISF